VFTVSVNLSIYQSVYLSVTRLVSASLCKNWLNRSRCCLGEHSWGPMEHCVRCGSWSPSRGGGGTLLNFGTLLISPEWLNLESWNFACVYRGGGPNKCYAKVGHRGSWAWSPDLILNFGILCANRDRGPNENYATVGHMRVRVLVTWPTFNFCDPLHILGTAVVIVWW